MKKRVLVSSTYSLGIVSLLVIGSTALSKVNENNIITANSFATDIQIINEGVGSIEILASDDLALFFDDNAIYQKGSLKVNYSGAINDYQVYKLKIELDPLLDNYITITNNSWKIGEELTLNAYYKKNMNPVNPTTYYKMCNDLKDATVKLTFSISYNQKESKYNE